MSIQVSTDSLIQYKIKDIERERFIATGHGLFEVHDMGKEQRLCVGCFYEGGHNKCKESPCTTGEWCGNLNSIIKPINLNKNGIEFQRSESERLKRRRNLLRRPRF